MTLTEKNLLILRSIVYNILSIHPLNNMNILEEEGYCTVSFFMRKKENIDLLFNKVLEIKNIFSIYLNIDMIVLEDKRKSVKFGTTLNIKITILPDADRDGIINYLRLTNQLNKDINSLVKDL